MKACKKNVDDIENELRSSIRKITVYHSHMSYALERTNVCISGAVNSSDPRCLLITGESGAGKSRLLEEAIGLPDISIEEGGVAPPFMYATIPSKPTVKGLSELLLNLLGDPAFDKGTEQVKTIRLRKLMKHVGVKVLVLDELQQFVDQGNEGVQHHLTDWLKGIVGSVKISLIVAGLPYSQQIIDMNKQLARRFYAPAHLVKFDWATQELRDEYVGILAAMQQEICEVKFPELSTPEMAFRMFCATEGNIGRLSNLLIEAACYAVKTKDREVTLKVLAKALKVCTYDIPGNLKEPFKVSVQLNGNK